MSASFNFVPSAVSHKLEPFTLCVPETDLAHFCSLLTLSEVGPVTWENSNKDRQFGISREWIVSARDYWLKQFDWRKNEDYINSFPNFKLNLQDERCGNFTVHFAALFSKHPDATPIVFLHGWPGSFLEFLPVLSLLQERFSQDSLPYHIIVPSLPGYGLSSKYTADNFTLGDASRLINNLMIELGFVDGYVVQGGDIGGVISMMLASTYEECKACHVNLIFPSPVRSEDRVLTDSETAFLREAAEFQRSGFAYAMEHVTRPATIRIVLSSSPIALLAWVGEKFLEWTDEEPTIEAILRMVTFYWFTSTLPHSLYAYRELLSNERPPLRYFSGKPFGYSRFPLEPCSTPESLAKEVANLTWFREHDKGGHFGAFEQPGLFLEDIIDFVNHVTQK